MCPVENIEDMQTEENINVCFSDNSYDNYNSTKIEKFWCRQIFSCLHMGLGIVLEDLLSEDYFIYKKKNVSQNKIV